MPKGTRSFVDLFFWKLAHGRPECRKFLAGELGRRAIMHQIGEVTSKARKHGDVVSKSDSAETAGSMGGDCSFAAWVTHLPAPMVIAEDNVPASPPNAHARAALTF
jgi:hypothetical protein